MLSGARIDNFSIGGLGFYTWIDLSNWFEQTGQWPDGASTLEQPQLVTEVFSTIRSQLQKERVKAKTTIKSSR